MKNRIVLLSKTLIMFALLSIFTACEKNDDINAIFREPTWYVTFVKEGNTTEYAKDKLYSIEFKNTLTATMPNGATIKGDWYADGEGSHSFYCRNLKKNGKIAGDIIAEKIWDILNNAQSYEGDTNWLQIIQDKDIYIQLYNK